MSIEIGQVIGQRYRVEAFLGKGGMAEVYQVWDQKRAVYLALKLLNDDLAEDKIFLRRFQREAQTLAQLQHPYIVRFYGLEKIGDSAFMLMDYVEGVTLRKEISRSNGPIELERVFNIIKPVCSALYYAHGQGMVHCDVKPANIMLHKNGTVLLADFGIARMTETATTTTLVGAGTPAYMAPEQVKGLDPTPQTDIYALGIVLYEMVTGGERPFTGEQAAINGTTLEKVRWEHMNLAPVSPRKYNRALSAKMEAVVIKCLEKEPSRRFVSPMELLIAFQAAIGTMEKPTASFPVKEDQKEAAPRPLEPPTPHAIKPQPAAIQLEEPRAVQVEGRSSRQVLKQRKPVYAIAAVLVLVAVLLGIAELGGNSSRAAQATATEAQVLAGQTASAANLARQVQQITQRAATQIAQQAAQSAASATASVVSAEHEQQSTLQAAEASTATQSALATLTRVAQLAPTQTALARIPPACTSIGQIWTSPMDGMTLVCVPAGKFLMGATASDKYAYNDDIPQHEVTLEAYWMDQTELTNEKYARCVQAGACSAPTDMKSDTRASYYGDAQYSNYPVIYVSWNNAQAYCTWAGRSLPSEAQWEKAARGTDVRQYPWGNTAPDAPLLNFNKNIKDTTEVGKYLKGASPYGALDMAGNTLEWVADWYGDRYYFVSPSSNPTGPSTGDERVLRGGSWWNDERMVRAWDRFSGLPGDTHSITGFRCSR